MKKWLCVLMLVVLVFCCGCGAGQSEPEREIYYNDQSYTLNTEEHTITHQDDVYRYEYKGNGFPKSFGLIIILILFGLWNLLSPGTVWYLERGWRYKDAEPSDMALGYIRFCGGVIIIIALVLCFI